MNKTKKEQGGEDRNASQNDEKTETDRPPMGSALIQLVSVRVHLISCVHVQLVR